MTAWREYLQEEFQASSALPLWREAFLGMDWIALRMSSVYRGIGIPRGDGSAVVVIPGFMGSDQYLGDMNAWLKRIDYRPTSPSAATLRPGRPRPRLHETSRMHETGGPCT
jgi:hypothetical protein